jgi:hypothetical protein
VRELGYAERFGSVNRESKNMNTRQTSQSGSLHPIVGWRWKVVVNGSNSHNGALYSATFDGDIPEAQSGKDAYDAASAIAKALKQLNAEMVHVHSLQITLGSPPNDQAQTRRE